ncbi:MAG TPA: hypothetical protein VHH34_17465, partial [Pseudonocardiaceae bacterium]|nr:hypothetical protein [Pseudonocardiaceae bacterium]
SARADRPPAALIAARPGVSATGVHGCDQLGMQIKDLVKGRDVQRPDDHAVVTDDEGQVTTDGVLGGVKLDQDFQAGRAQELNAGQVEHKVGGGVMERLCQRLLKLRHRD